MKALIRFANEFLKQSDWRDLALIKLCLLSTGIMLGVALPKKARKPVVFTAVILFTITYLSIIHKVLGTAALFNAREEKSK